MDFSPAVTSLIVGIPASIISYLGYRLVRRTDSATIVASGTQQLINNLQEDNRIGREREKIKDIKINELEKIIITLERLLNRFYKKYGEDAISKGVNNG